MVWRLIVASIIGIIGVSIIYGVMAIVASLVAVFIPIFIGACIFACIFAIALVALDERSKKGKPDVK